MKTIFSIGLVLLLVGLIAFGGGRGDGGRGDGPVESIHRIGSHSSPSLCSEAGEDCIPDSTHACPCVPNSLYTCPCVPNSLYICP